MGVPLHVLLVEDSAEYSAYLTEVLSVSDGSFRTTRAGTAGEAIAHLAKGGIDVVLLDLSLPDSEGLETLHRVNRAAAGTAVVILSGLLDHTLAVAALQAGAQEYLVKSEIGAGGISRVIRYAIERVNTDLRLRERDAHYRSIVESSFDAIICMDDSGVTEFNPKAEEMFGRRRADVIGKELADLIVPERMRDAHLQGVRRQLANPDAAIARQRFELTGLRADGSEFPVELTLSKQSSARGPACTAFIRDVSERNRALTRIAEQASMLDQARDAILVRDLDHRVTYFNKSAERLYGWTADDVLGRSVRERFFPDPAVFDETMVALLEQGGWQGELSTAGMDGTRLTVESRWTLMRGANGLPFAVLVIDTDITERKELERRFLRAQRMESIGTLAGGIAHDLNNMLAPVLMSIELLRDNPSEQERDQILATVETSARRGAEMVRQVLSFARGVEGDRAPVDVARLLKEVEKFANDTFMKHIRVRTTVDEGATVLGDATQLHQVLINLCVNARDAMPQGGILSLSAGAESVVDRQFDLGAIAAPGDFVVIRVSDTGTGIPPAVLDRMFEPFFTSKATGKGTGLGLSTSLAIVKSHGGIIRVESTVGQGSEFTVYLPARAERAEPATAHQSTTAARGTGELILVVDDEEAVLRMASLVLESFGYRVLSASSGDEALALFSAHRHEVKVLFTDMTMPDMDGAALIPKLRAINPDLRVVAASGLGAQQAAHVTGVMRFLAKPYTADSVLKAITDAVRA